MRAAMLGEFGGLGRRVEGHELDPARSFSYIMMNTTEQLEEGYHAFAMKARSLCTWVLALQAMCKVGPAWSCYSLFPSTQNCNELHWESPKDGP